MKKVYCISMLVGIVGMGVLSGCGAIQNKVNEQQPINVQITESNQASKIGDEDLQTTNPVLEQQVEYLQTTNQELQQQVEQLQIENKILRDDINRLAWQAENLAQKVYDNEKEFAYLAEQINNPDQSKIGENQEQKLSIYVREFGEGLLTREVPNVLYCQAFGEGEYLELDVKGKITNLRAEVINGSEEGETKILAEEVKDQKVIIETRFPCGMPFETIRWDDEAGGGGITPAGDGRYGVGTVGYYYK